MPYLKISPRVGEFHRFAIVAVLMLAGCGTDDTTAPEQLTLYALNPVPIRDKEKKDPADTGRFHGYRIRQKCDISDPAVRSEIVDALRSGISESDPVRENCFDPKHGLRCVVDGETIDYVISYRCRAVTIYQNGHDETTATTTDASRALIDRYIQSKAAPRSR